MISFKLFVNKLFIAFDLSESFWLKYFIKSSISTDLKEHGVNNEVVTDTHGYPFDLTAGKKVLPAIAPVLVFEYIKYAWSHEPVKRELVRTAGISGLCVHANTTLLPLPAGIVIIKNVFNNLCVAQFKENEL